MWGLLKGQLKRKMLVAEEVEECKEKEYSTIAFNQKIIDGKFLELDWFNNSGLFVMEDAITENMLSSTVKAVISMLAIAVLSLLEIVTVGSIGDNWALLTLQNLFIKIQKESNK